MIFYLFAKDMKILYQNCDTYESYFMLNFYPHYRRVCKHRKSIFKDFYVQRHKKKMCPYKIHSHVAYLKKHNLFLKCNHICKMKPKKKLSRSKFQEIDFS